MATQALVEQFERLESLRGYLDIASKETRLAELEPKLNDPNLWNNPDEAKKISQEATRLRKVLETYSLLKNDLEGLEELYELASEEEMAELEAEKESLQAKLDELYRETLFSGDYDDRAAILTIKPGAGGTEAQDWAGMLFRMYRRFAERKGFNVEILDAVGSDSAPQGIDYAQMIVRGERAFGMLHVEGGVHRLVRTSPFDSNNRRHTSFASIELMPEIDDDIQIDIDPKDIRVDVYRSSGPGGQSVNTTDSAVRMVYKAGTPEEIVVTCQDGKSQIKNREKAFTVLKSRLWEREERRRKEEQMAARGEQKAIEWGSQIRSYVLDKQYIKDHRSGDMRHDPDNVLDGDIEDLIWAGLEWEASGRTHA
ncbi:MAG: peptide chain release factor 2 [Trueperaceae bacterium]|nr:peptide chain release factor 2 [Trueperaceae bacterium]